MNLNFDDRELSLLFEKYVNNELTKDELSTFLELFNDEKNIPKLQALMNQVWDGSALKYEQIKDIPVIPLQQKRINYKSLLKYAAVIALPLFVAVFYFTSKTNFSVKDNTSSVKIAKKEAGKSPLIPGGNKAILIYEDQSIALDTAKAGILGSNGGINISKNSNGQISCKSGGLGEVKYATLITPKGGQYQITLPDNSKAWLNSASSLKFPSAFNGKTREVEITGEVYFEIAKDASKPFLVSAKNIQVQVLGTHFNVNSYSDEPASSTTLLEGSVKITETTTKQTRLIKPGQQIFVNNGGQISQVNNVNVNEVMAWKNGLFQFKNVDLKTIMRQVARWYDAEVYFESNVKKNFTGIISRSVSINEFLKLMEETGSVHFKIIGNKIYVTQ